MDPRVEDEKRSREREVPGLAPHCTDLAWGRLEPCPPGGLLSRAPAYRQARPWGPGSPLQLCPPGQVRTWAGVWRLRREWLAWLWPTSPGPPRPRGDRGGPAGDGEACGGRGSSPAARPPHGPASRCPPSHVSVFLFSSMLWQWCPVLMRQYLVQPQAVLFQVIS